MFSTLLLAALAAQPVIAVNEPNARIVVAGAGSVKTPPDVARLAFDVKGEGKTSDQAVTELVAKSAAIERALKAVDPALELHSERMKVSAVRGKDCDADDYDDGGPLSTGACAIIGYITTQDFDVRTSRVGDAGTMVGLASRLGASEPRIAAFDLSDDSEPRRQAIAVALRNARARAEAVATGSSARLGPVILVSVDGAEDEELVPAGSARAEPGPPAPPPPPPIAVKVEPEPVETTASVKVTYAIAR